MGDIDGRTDRSNTREHMSQSGSRASFKSGKAFPNSHGLTRMFTDVSAVGDRRYRRRNLRKRGTEEWSRGAASDIDGKAETRPCFRSTRHWSPVTSLERSDFKRVFWI